jgi:GNAT superfamily N-acetyltransferase
MVDIATRLADEGDLEALRAVYRSASLSNAGDRANLLGSPEALHWAGDGIAAGGTRVVPIEGGLELEDLFVDPPAMRQGVATRLVLDLVRAAARDGVSWIEVTANDHAAEFYASAAFVQVGEEQTLFGPAPRLRREL